MFRKGRLIAIALVALAVLLGGQTRPEPVAESRPAAEHKSTDIPFELSSNKPFVQVRVNDSDPLWFIFDTGAGKVELLKATSGESPITRFLVVWLVDWPRWRFALCQAQYL